MFRLKKMEHASYTNGEIFIGRFKYFSKFVNFNQEKCPLFNYDTNKLLNYN